MKKPNASPLSIELPEIKDSKLSWKKRFKFLFVGFLIALVSAWSYEFYANSDAAISWLHSNMWMVIALGLFALGDDITTEIALRQSNGQGEMNPIANAFFKKKHGKIIVRLYKWPLIAFLVVAMAASQDDKAALFITVAYGLVVLNNIRAITEGILCPEITKAIRAIPTNTRMYVIRIFAIFAIAAFVAYGAEHIV